MALLDFVFGSASEKAQLAAMKFGKTQEQKDVIDYFMTDGGCGCLGKSKLNADTYLGLVNQKCASLNLRERALAKIGLDESQVSEIPPILMTSFVYDNKHEDGNTRLFRKFDDNMYVTSRYAVTWIFFSAEQMYTYKYVFNMTSDDTLETTNDIFYRDITNLRTVTEQNEDIRRVAGCGCLAKDKADKQIYSYSKFVVVGAGFGYSYEMRTTETIEQSIQAAKAMLREKKYAK